MQRKIIYTILILAIILGLAPVSRAEMQSENYHIKTSVFSSGGTPIASGSFQIDSTLGQSSPLMDPEGPPYSMSYDLYPGFWHTIEAAIAVVCQGDFDVDGDVDGSDLATLAASPWLVDLSLFANDFGRTDCLH
jgi:hypothetical protein